jgi:GMP synthase-like glutamine amidotransferase
MRIQSFEHVPFEGPAALADWARARGHSLDRTRVFAGQPLPRVQDVDLLFVMGGPMSVHDEAACPWLAPEKAFLRQAVERGVRILGICLGAQMLAEALGGEVRRNPGPEIGWFPVELLIENCASELVDAPLVQSAGRMRAMCDTSGPMRPLLDTLLDTLARTA